jgi:catechol 2,3-dioxygenase-like lactoylglutathione lyase family enzyme
MLDHIGIGVSDLAASRDFYTRALRPLGIGIVMDVQHAVGLGSAHKPFFWIASSPIRPAPLHIAFVADSRQQVDEFYREAIAAGGTDNGAPGLRPQYHPNYYGAFVYGPDGHNVEAVCHKPEA